MIQPIITSTVSRMALKKEVSMRRPSGSTLVRAKANSRVNTISDRKALLAAAATTLVGTSVVKNSAIGGGAVAGASLAIAPRSASAEAAGMGTISRNRGVRTAAMIVLGIGFLVLPLTHAPPGVTAVAAKYPQYRAAPPAGPFLEIAVEKWTQWRGDSG